MMEAEIYGMMPRPKIVLWLRLPPENIEIRPSSPSSEPRIERAISIWLIIGSGT